MKPAGNLVTAFLKLSSCMQLGNYNLQGRSFVDWVRINWNASPIINYLNRAILIYRDKNRVAIARHCLINRIINYFVNKMMQSWLARASNVHGRAMPYSLQPFNHFDMLRAVRFGLFFTSFSRHFY